ncbi:MAG: HlyD family secretion protein [Gammaproteobacteria bacterium]
MFRPQAIAHAGTRSYGAVLLARPVSYSYLTLLFVIVGAGIVAFLVLFSYTRKAHVPGVLLPAKGLIRVLPAQAGVIAERRAHEGQAVKTGDVLFVLTSERASSAHGNVERAISSLLQSRRDSLAIEKEQLRQQANERTAAARRRADDLALEIRRIDGQIVLQQRRIALAEEALKRYTDLRVSKFVSAVQVQDKQVDLLDQQQRLADLQRTKLASEREVASVQASLRDLKLQAQRDLQAWQRSIAAIEQDLAENDARRDILVRAPQDGTVTAITAERGQSVSGNQALASILPAGTELEAELYAPSRSAGFVKPGMEVLLRYQAYSYQKFGQAQGRVREVSSTAMRPEELTLPGAASSVGTASEPLYRVRVKLDRQSVTAYGVELPLKSGAVLDASVLLERRRLYEWVLEPLYTISGRL